MEPGNSQLCISSPVQVTLINISIHSKSFMRNLWILCFVRHCNVEKNVNVFSLSFTPFVSQSYQKGGVTLSLAERNVGYTRIIFTQLPNSSIHREKLLIMCTISRRFWFRFNEISLYANLLFSRIFLLTCSLLFIAFLLFIYNLF